MPELPQIIRGTDGGTHVALIPGPAFLCSSGVLHDHLAVCSVTGVWLGDGTRISGRGISVKVWVLPLLAPVPSPSQPILSFTMTNDDNDESKAHIPPCT